MSPARRRRRTSAGLRVARSHRGVGERARYRFDLAMARGPMQVILYLALLSVVIIVFGALVATVLSTTFGGGRDGSFLEDVWQTMLRMLDSGTFAGDAQWPTRVLGFTITLTGIFLAGSLIGLIANAVDQKVEQLRRGHNRVIESGHTLILGWSAAVPRIVGELVLANESERGASIVVLSRSDAPGVEEEIRSRIGDLKTTRLVCRTGDPAVPSDLERVAVEHARSIVIVRGEAGDAGVVKAVLAVRAVGTSARTAHVVAELAHAGYARTLRSVSDGRILTVSSDDVVAQVTAQACLRSGLGTVFAELLDFDGDELYFAPVPDELVGHTYREALVSYESSSVLGVATAAVVELNPHPAWYLEAGDELIMVAADDSVIEFSGLQPVTEAVNVEPLAFVASSVHIVFVGWSERGAKVLRALDPFLADDSRIDVVADPALVIDGSLDDISLANADVFVHPGDGGFDHLDGSVGASQPDQVIVVGYRDVLAPDEADARTLLSLLLLRQRWPASGPQHTRIVAELLDQRNLELARPVGVDDLIVSDALASLLMAQLSERADLHTVFDDLFDADGAVVDLVAVQSVVPPGPYSWRAVVEVASARGMSAFGYRQSATSAVTINPPKSAIVNLQHDDEIVVVATRPSDL